MKYLKKFNEDIKNELHTEWLKISDDLHKKGVIITVNFTTTHEKDRGNLVMILMDIKSKKTGMGTEGMLKLTKFADANKLNIWLIASTNYGSDSDRLVEFYNRFGFTKVGNHYLGSEMVRKYK